MMIDDWCLHEIDITMQINAEGDTQHIKKLYVNDLSELARIHGCLDSAIRGIWKNFLWREPAIVLDANGVKSISVKFSLCTDLSALFAEATFI